MGEILAEAVAVTGSRAEAVWVPADVLADEGVEGWTELPLWLPPGAEFEGMRTVDASAARAAGLVCRSMEETVRDTWDWLRAEGDPEPRAGIGLEPEKERRVLGRFRGGA
ncbi:hypothetical protein [Actinomadura atramentaria]|uniref:hypothetical protein n=1 Tax=Actinomadura atramentaria TaxID=1990 RepID=UPI0003A6001F